MGPLSLFVAILFAILPLIMAVPASTARVPGCMQQKILKGVNVKRMVANDRSYWYRLPLNYTSTKQYPVVLGFHGSSKIGAGLDGIGFEADSRLNHFSHDVCWRAQCF